MAGITTTSCSFQMSTPISSRHVPNPLRLSLTSPRLFRFPRASRGPGSCRCRYARVVVARYGGRGREYSPEAEESDTEDEALDLSRIRSDTVRLIDEQQNMVGIVSKDEAMQTADDAKKDLVIISADADPPVVRIMDYEKYMYGVQKKKREQQKKSAATRMDIKELKMGYNIDAHDYSVRLKAARKFLKEGDKVKIIVHLKGRNEYRSTAIDLIKRFQEDVGELAIEESKNLREKNIYMVLLPNKTVLQKAQEQPKKKEVTMNA